jgi:hypothetical protein
MASKGKRPSDKFTSPVAKSSSRAQPEPDHDAAPAKPKSASKVRGDSHQGGTKRSIASETRSKASESGSKGDKYSQRYTPPTPQAGQMPSPTWVPVLMFVLLGAGMLIIILNYVGIMGDASNWRLILGLGFILGGIMVATQYR